MIPWLVILARTLPSAAVAAHWPAAWTGLDGMEAVGLLTTGLALIRRYPWVSLPAAVTATLLVIDAWFDVTTSAPGSAAGAIAMAAFPELPMAALCIVLAVRHAPGRQLSPQRRAPRNGLPQPGLEQLAARVAGKRVRGDRDELRNLVVGQPLPAAGDHLR